MVKGLVEKSVELDTPLKKQAQALATIGMWYSDDF
jgi:hypothetical protein